MDQMLPFAKLYRVYCSEHVLSTKDDTDYLVDHSVFFYLMGPDGKFVTVFGRDKTVPEMVQAITHDMAMCKLLDAK